MRTISAPLLSLLNSSTTVVFADLVTVVLSGGQVLRYSGADQPISHNGNTYVLGPYIRRSRTRCTVGISVDTLDLDLTLPDEVLVNNVPIAKFVSAGGLDGATVQLERVFAASDIRTPTGGVILFAGRVDDVQVHRGGAKVGVVSDLSLLDVKVPSNLFQPACSVTLFDSVCGVSRAGWQSSSTVTNTPTPTNRVFDSALAPAAGLYDLGSVTFTSGQNAGISRTVRSCTTGGTFTLIAPLPFAPAAGDAFTVLPGCDKTMATCSGRFNNLPRYRGQPFIPVAETVA